MQAWSMNQDLQSHFNNYMIPAGVPIAPVRSYRSIQLNGKKTIVSSAASISDPFAAAASSSTGYNFGVFKLNYDVRNVSHTNSQLSWSFTHLPHQGT